MGRGSWCLPALALLLLSACREGRDVQHIDNPAVEPDKEGDAVTRDSPDAGQYPVDPQPRPDGGQVDPPQTCPPQCPDAGVPDELTRSVAPNPIPAENALPGNPNWRKGGSAASNGEVEGYTSVDSLFAGEPLGVKVSTSVDQTVTAEVYRIGHYGGAGARLIWRGGPFATHRQPNCLRSWDTARVECDWEETFQVPTEASWVSGFYVVKLIRADGYRRFTPFVLRDRRQADVLYGVAFNTYQAYNLWGGESLYADASGTMPQGRAFEVSYDRPYREIEGMGKVSFLEFSLIATLEKGGYDVSYVSNLDFVRFKNLLDGVGAFVHGSQDEYWNEEQRTQLDAALAGGRLSLAYFGGNGAYWRTRTTSSATGVSHRVLVCYKGSPQDPLPGSTRRFRDEPDAWPENALLGSMYDGWQLMGFPLVVKDASHWVFAGTGLEDGDQLPPLIGFEFDKVANNGFSPPGLEVAFESPVVTAEGIPSRSHGVSRTLPSGTIVFSAGTIWWPDGLSKSANVADGRIERMTLNVLERALAHRRKAGALPPPPSTRPPAPQVDGRWAQSVEAFAGVAGSAGFLDGPAASARFSGPTGLAVDPLGRVAVADTGNNAIRLIDVDEARTVTTIAGTGAYGHRNGAGNQAMFRAPTSVVFAPDGSIYVADSDNHAIRKIASDSAHTVSTYAGVLRASGSTDGPAETARFRRPTALAIDPLGNVYVADQAGNRIRRIDATTHEVTTVAGGLLGYQDAAFGVDAQFNNPSAIAVGPTGELFVTDAGNGRIRRISATPEHSVDTVAGPLEEPWYGMGDGSGAGARFRAQMGMAVTASGELIVGDTGNFRLRKIVPGADAASTQVYTLAGNGRVGRALGTGEEANLTSPAGVVYLPGDPERFLVTDAFQNVVRLIIR